MRQKKDIIKMLLALDSEKDQYIRKDLAQGDIFSPDCTDLTNYERLIEKTQTKIELLKWVLKI